jgi:hypothetical protein
MHQMYGFLVVIFLTLGSGEVMEFQHPKVFQEISECAAFMTRVQAFSRDHSVLDAGCRSYIAQTSALLLLLLL